ncbi:pilus assembly protein [Sphingomonas sp. HITSZ_GF]|uniref:TadE/TadG family type IV pilus assembly protein n=1 Tax=Sphingomonas sp. HITSZ_GF TaxID=3037247 RepID=UPI00240DFCCB|nr:TadE/TadG family type IV pilus assembly protein [Sphingomonas sp. HITSZ_GF]MDG2532619.1 pilus assembly protein [Sphingomonas sp. HITSZ_GF]
MYPRPLRQDFERFRAAPGLWRDRRGAAAIEMAFSLPILLMLICGIVTYGGWFLCANSVQQAANEAARAAIGGLDPSERAGLVRQALDANMRKTGTLKAERMNSLIDDDGHTLTVHLSYDAAKDPLMSIKLVPLPATMIERSATITLSAP